MVCCASRLATTTVRSIRPRVYRHGRSCTFVLSTSCGCLHPTGSSWYPRLAVSPSSAPASVIVPFHRNLDQLQRCLSAIRQSAPDVELIVAADGTLDDCRPTAAQHGAR